MQLCWSCSPICVRKVLKCPYSGRHHWRHKSPIGLEIQNWFAPKWVSKVPMGVMGDWDPNRFLCRSNASSLLLAVSKEQHSTLPQELSVEFNVPPQSRSASLWRSCALLDSRLLRNQMWGPSWAVTCHQMELVLFTPCVVNGTAAVS